MEERDWSVLPGLIPVHLADQLLACDVGAEVGQSEEPVVVEQHVHQVLELSLITGGEEAISDHVNNLERKYHGREYQETRLNEQ